MKKRYDKDETINYVDFLARNLEKKGETKPWRNCVVWFSLFQRILLPIFTWWTVSLFLLVSEFYVQPFGASIFLAGNKNVIYCELLLKSVIFQCHCYLLCWQKHESSEIISTWR
jgi:hypothetical protein